MPKGVKIRDSLMGRKINRLTIVTEPYSKIIGGKKRRVVDCLCECGNEVIGVLLFSLISGHSKSCGCAKRKFEDPIKNSILKKAFYSMRHRCYNPTNKHYNRYGGRGIIVCPEWHNYDTFYNDMHETWAVGLQLDRVDNDGIYCKINCRWATPLIQQRNKSTVVFNKETIAEVRKSKEPQYVLAAKYGVNQSTISRIKNNLRWQ